MSNQMLIYSTQNTFVVPCLHVALLPIYGTVLSLFIYNTDHDSFHQRSVHTSHGTIGPYHRPPRCRKLSMNWAYGPSGRIETVARLWSLIVITWYLLYAVFFEMTLNTFVVPCLQRSLATSPLDHPRFSIQCFIVFVSYLLSFEIFNAE